LDGIVSSQVAHSPHSRCLLIRQQPASDTLTPASRTDRFEKGCAPRVHQLTLPLTLWTPHDDTVRKSHRKQQGHHNGCTLYQ